ncbi:(acyl-carrier-protein) dehydratase [gut metagenome]|uniref:(Acyl-carrier-protein) dehydratase n=1 Tax=gut metagenome TaxID=749906 RepID=J9G669_9ZZZZ
MKGGDIKHLIPQREPILMVDELLDVQGEQAHTSLTIRPANYFLDDQGRLEASGLIEHMAQSASAFAGYQAVQAGAANPPVGYIGEVKNFQCYHYPKVGDVLHTVICFGPEVEGVILCSGITYVDEQKLAETQMKIYIPK